MRCYQSSKFRIKVWTKILSSWTCSVDFWKQNLFVIKNTLPSTIEHPRIASQPLAILLSERIFLVLYIGTDCTRKFTWYVFVPILRNTTSYPVESFQYRSNIFCKNCSPTLCRAKCVKNKQESVMNFINKGTRILNLQLLNLSSYLLGIKPRDVKWFV